MHESFSFFALLFLLTQFYSICINFVLHSSQVPFGHQTKHKHSGQASSQPSTLDKATGNGTNRFVIEICQNSLFGHGRRFLEDHLG